MLQPTPRDAQTHAQGQKAGLQGAWREKGTVGRIFVQRFIWGDFTGKTGHVYRAVTIRAHARGRSSGEKLTLLDRGKVWDIVMDDEAQLPVAKKPRKYSPRRKKQ